MVSGDFRPLLYPHISEIQKSATFRQSASFGHKTRRLPTCLCNARSVRSVYDRETEKKSRIVIFHVCLGAPHPTSCDECSRIC
jgi:hypothetical protein